MEIYLYFVDEIFPAVSSATLFVILVEEGDEENLQIRPVVNTIKDDNGLYIKEVEFLRRHRKEIRKEKLYIYFLNKSTTCSYVILMLDIIT